MNLEPLQTLVITAQKDAIQNLEMAKQNDNRHEMAVQSRILEVLQPMRDTISADLR